jgi:hypothetical protein
LKFKSSTTTTNLTSSFIKATSIVQKKWNLPKWIWQQTNEVAFDETNSCKNTHLTKCTLAKTQTYKGSKKIVNKWWKLKPNTLFLLWKKKDNNYNVIFIWEERPNPKPFCILY